MSSTKKILYVVTKSEPFGGAQKYVYDLATHLPKTFEPIVALGKGGPLKKKLDDSHVRTVVVQSFQKKIHLVKEVRAFFELLYIYRTEKPDIVHLNSSKAGGLGALAARVARVKNIIFTAHGLVFEEQRNWITRQVLRFLTWLTLLLSHETIVISRNNLNTMRGFVGVKNKLHHIYNGITPPTFLERAEARAKLASYAKEKMLNDKTVVVGTVAELVPNKGLTYLVHAWKAFVATNNNIVCIIIGHGELYDTLKTEIHTLGLTQHIFLLGYIPNAATCLRAFDIFVLPSLKEGHPYALLEAGYAAIPVISTNIPGVTDIVTDMKSGILIRPKNSDEINRALAYLLKHPDKQNTFGHALYNNVIERFKINTMINKTMTLYEKV